MEIKPIPPTEWEEATPERVAQMAMAYGCVTTITGADGVQRIIPPEEFYGFPEEGV